MSGNQCKKPGNSGYILTRHNLDVARNTTLEEVSCNMNGFLFSEHTIYRCIDGNRFNNDIISISDNKEYGRPFSALIKTRIL